MGWLIALAILLVIGMTPLGVSLIYQKDGMMLWLLMGLIRIKLYPRPHSKPKEKKTAQPPKKQSVSSGNQKPKDKKNGGKLTDFLPLVELVLEFLGSVRRKLRVRHLELELVMAADDPCDLAVNYGRAWAAVGNLMPLLEQVFVIRKRNVDVQCDFTAEVTTIYLRVDLTITVGRILGLGGRYGIRVLSRYLKIMKSIKGGAVK